MSILLCPFTLTAKEHKKVRVIGFTYDTLFKVDKNQRPISGYAYEYISKVAAYAGWDVEYILTDHFTSALQKMKEGEGDIFYDLSRTPERESFFLFPQLPMGTEQYVLFAKKGNSSLSVTDLQNLSGKKIGVSEGTFQYELLKQWRQKNNLDFEIVLYNSYPKKTEDILSGKIDFDCEVREFALSEYSLYTLLGNSDYFLVADKSRPDLLEDINTAQRKLQFSDPFFISRLNEKYFYEREAAKSLSIDQLEWLSAHDTIRIGCLDNYFPYSYYDVQTGKPRGLLLDLTSYFLNKLNLQNTKTNYFIYANMTEMIQALHNDVVDVIFPYYKSPLPVVEDNIITSKEILSAQMSAVYKVGTDFQKSLNKIGIIGTGFAQFFVRDTFPKSQIRLYDTLDDCLKAVQKGEVSCTIFYTDILYDKVWEEDTLLIRDINNNCPLTYAACSDNIILISIMDRASSITRHNEITALDNNYNIPKQMTLSAVLKSHRVLFMTVAVIILLILSLAFIQLFIAHKRLIGAKGALEIQHKQLEEALERANLASKAKTAFLFNMSHDIRTPMNAVIGFCNMAVKNIGNTLLLKGYLTKLQKAGEFLKIILNDVLDMSNIEKGNIKLSLAEANIRSIFNTLEPVFLSSASQKNIQLSFSVGCIKNEYVYMDQERVLKILTNLINNALSFNKEGGWVKVALSQTDELDNGDSVYSFTIEDNGLGISEEFQEHIFELFAKEQNSTQTGIQGTGIGLTLCKNLVDLMNGTITCRSSKNVGSLFTVNIPFKIAKEKETILPSDSNRFDIGILAKKKCLIAEDNELNSEILLDILFDAEMAADTAENGKIAVEKLRQYGPDYYDFILMDIQMPIMDGYEATEIIRATYPEYHIPIIAVSANAFEDDVKRSLDSGMDAHLAKPIEPNLLYNTMVRFMR